MAYIKTIEHDEATGELRGIYDHLVATRGKLADVHKIQSLNPPSVLSHMNLYKDIMFGQSPLKRYQREMIAVVVSDANQCEYCMKHHREALLHYWKSNEKIDYLVQQSEAAQLSDEDKALCQYAREVTLNPELRVLRRILKRETRPDSRVFPLSTPDGQKVEPGLSRI
ncbi:MAG: peroxidase-related enzyme [Flammeovirgaceae bacterium]|nr:peroxidase-related enzyme [Flammeovirgaceae bacterium]